VSNTTQGNDEARNFQALLNRLQEGEVSHLPENETWEEMMRRIAPEGVIAEVTRETYWWFLEVVPPAFMNGSCFCFAEGASPFRLFWEGADRYFTRQLSSDETWVFRRLARLAA
jgi:hypothetical protein